jgi:hypothetical protein
LSQTGKQPEETQKSMMQVKLMASFANAAAEKSAKTPDLSDAHDESSFSSHIGSMLDKETVRGEGAAEEKIPAKIKKPSGDKSSTNPQAAALAVSIAAPADKLPAPDGRQPIVTGGESQIVANAQLAGLQFPNEADADIPAGFSLDSGVAPAAAPAAGSFETNLSGLNIQAPGSQTDIGKNRNSTSNEQNAVQLELKLGSENFIVSTGFQASEIRVFQNTEQPPSVPDGINEGTPTKNESAIPAGTTGRLDAATVPIPLKSNRIDPDGSQMNFAFPGREGPAQEIDSISKLPWIPDDGFLPKLDGNNPDVNIEAPGVAFRAALAKKPESMPQVTVDGMDPGNTLAEQSQLAEKFSSWTAYQAKPDSDQPIFRNLQMRSSENTSQTQSAFAASVTRYAESGSPSNAAQSASAAPRSPEFVFHLAEQIRIQLREGKGEIRIQLRPENLGRLEIRAETTLTGISARITAESGTVKNYLENNLQLLQQSLQNQDLRIDRIYIVAQDPVDAQFSQGYAAQSGNAGYGQRGKESNANAGSDKSVIYETPSETVLDAAAWLAMNPNNRFYTVA